MPANESRANESPARVRLATAAVVITVFLAGALVGVGVERWSASRAELAAVPPRGFGVFLPLEGLELTPEQHTKIDAILERHQRELETLLRESYPRARAVGDRLEAEIQAVLTPEQQRKFAELKRKSPRLPTPTFQKRSEELELRSPPSLPPLPPRPDLRRPAPRPE
jgi:Spy/CpxP family protein refolding chaperone